MALMQLMPRGGDWTVDDLDLTAKAVTTGLILAVEVLSPSSRRVDHVLKREVYASAGVPWYWIVDPDEPSLLVLRLDGDRYTEAGRATGDESVRSPGPFDVIVTPQDLVTR